MRRGFTLVEIMLSLVVIGFLLIVIFQTFFVGFNIFFGETARTDNLAEANRAMERMAQELRAAREIQIADPANITFWWRDEIENGTSEASELISYSWAGVTGGDLLRTKSPDTSILAKNVNNFALTYDSTTKASIRLITITLQIKSGDETTNSCSTIRPRNL